MSEPFIDILMATYNGERYVGEQIESIQAQTYGNWRLLVSDDCSTDGTLNVVRRYKVARSLSTRDSMSKRAGHFIKSGCRKRGMRKFGQAAVLMIGDK